MDVFFPQSVGRNGVDSGYFDLIGIGEGKSKAKKLLVSVNAELSAAYPPADTAIAQDKVIAKLEADLRSLKQNRDKAKSKKTRNTLDARVKAYEAFISDMKKYRDELASIEQKEAESAAAEAEAAAAAAEVERLRIEKEKGIVTPPIYDQSEITVKELPKTTLTEPGDLVLTKTTKDDTILGNIKKTLSSLTGGGAAEPAEQAGATPTGQAGAKKSNTLLWVGIGAAILVGFLLTRKKA